MTRRIAVVFAAAALLSSGVARAQAHRQPGTTPPPAPPSSEGPQPTAPSRPTPRPAPQPQPGAQATAQAPQAGQLTEEQRSMLGTLHARNEILVASGLLATQRAQSNEVRQYGERLQSEHRRVQTELSQLVSERGATLESLPQATEELRSNHQRLTTLQSLPPEQFDREFAVALKDLGRQYEADLKRMRDATPGKDARLKSWLDQTEDLAEADRLAAQQLIDRMNAQRQARTPATSTGR